MAEKFLVEGKVLGVKGFGNWILLTLSGHEKPVAFKRFKIGESKVKFRVGDRVSVRVSEGRTWLFGDVESLRINRSKVKAAGKKVEEYAEIEVKKLLLHPIHAVSDRRADEDLINNIREHGILEPLIVRKISEDRYEILAGSRRLDAAEKVGLTKVPCRIIEADDETASLIALWENLHREDLNPISLAKSLKYIIDKHELTHEKLAKRLNKSKTLITNYLRLLKLPEKVQELIKVKRLTFYHGLILLKVGEQNKDLIERLADLCVENDWSARQLEEYVNRHLCSHCKSWIEPEETIFIDNMYLCSNCYDDYTAFIKAHEERVEAKAVVPIEVPEVSKEATDVEAPTEAIEVSRPVEVVEAGEEEREKSQEEMYLAFLREQLDKVKAAFNRAVNALSQAAVAFKSLEHECGGDCEDCIANNVCRDFLNQLNSLKICIIDRWIHEWILLSEEASK